MAKTGDQRLNELRAKRNRNAPTETANWGDVSGKVVVEAIAWAAATGGALRFGYTRDAGAYAIGIYTGQEHHTEYVRPSEDIERYLVELAEDFEAVYRAEPKK